MGSCRRRLGLLVILMAGCSTCAPQTEIETLTLADGNVTIQKEGSFYTFRRNQWSFYSWIHGATNTHHPRDEIQGTTPPVLIHFDAHSDMHPAPSCAEPESLRAGSLPSAERYTIRLSISNFILPTLYYGVVREVYWVQPPISAYQGGMETVPFDLEERDGWIRIVPKPGAQPLDTAAWSIRSYRGESVPRNLDVAVAAGMAAEDWAAGPYTLHCLSFEQLIALEKEGRFDGIETVFDLDLDYFGTSGSLRGYGYLAFTKGSHIALGALGGTLPVFYRSLKDLESEAGILRDFIRRLSPQVVAMAESPDHAHRGMIPSLEGWIETDLLPGRRERPLLGLVSLRTGESLTDLSPDCPVSVNLKGAASFTVDLSRGPEVGEALEMALYHNPHSSDDQLVWRKDLAAGASSVECPLAAFFSNGPEPLGAGWDLEIRQKATGFLLWSSEFCLDDDGWLLRSTLEDLVQSGRLVEDNPAHYISMAPSRIIAEGRRNGLNRNEIHRLLLAHPGVWEHQCRNLQSFREQGGLVGR